MKATCKAVNSREEPAVELHAVRQLPENTNCMACTEDGRYLSLGSSRGLSVWHASSLTRVAEWLQDGLEITSIQMTRMAEMTYLLGTVDYMGVASVFAFHSAVIQLLSVFNTMEDINTRSICLTFDLYEGGHYAVASVSCSASVWLEVYQFPLAAWLKELETTTPQKQDLNVSGNMCEKCSPVTLLIKITQPKVPSGGTADGALGVTHPADFLTHCLALDIISTGHKSERLSFSAGVGKTKETHGSSRRCTWHFLLPCGPFTVENKSDLQPDVARMPDMLWPNAKEIVCSAVSRCTRYVALGLDDALVCVWDRRSGTPLSTVLMPDRNSALFKIQFVENWPMSVNNAQIIAANPVHLLVLCKSGSMFTITAEQGTQSCIVQLSERLEDSRDLPTVTVSVPFLRAVSLVVQINGKLFLQDVANNTPVCFLTLPASHRIASPCRPIYELNTQHQTLFIRGDWNLSFSASSEDSQLFVFRFKESEILNQYFVSHLDPPQPHTPHNHYALEELCDLYFQQRVLSADERNKALMVTWKKLQETAGQQKPRGHSHLHFNR